MKTISLLLFCLMLFSASAFSQSAKKFTKAAETFFESGNYQDAIDNYTKAIELEPNEAETYVARANTFLKLNKTEEALVDFERATTLDPKEEEYAYNASNYSYLLGKYEAAIKYANAALEIDKKMLGAFHVKIVSLLSLNLLDEALETSVKAVDVKRSYQTYYDKAAVLFAQKNFKEAQNYYQMAISDDTKNINGYLGSASTFYFQNLFDQSISAANSALNIDQRSRDAYMIRAQAYHKKLDYLNAINDLSQIIVLYPNETFIKDVLFARGQIYYDFKQHLSAIADFTSVIDKDKKYYEAYFKRAASYEAIHSFDKAIADYEKLDGFNLTDEKNLVLLSESHLRLFELKREEDRPVIVVSQPNISANNYIQIIQGKDIQRIQGRIDDASPIKSFTINGKKVTFDSTSKKNEYYIDLPVKDMSEVAFTVSDVYDNVKSITYPIERTEVDAPVIMMVQPMASDDGQIYIDSKDPSIYIEGGIMDASKIASIKIDSINASYSPGSLNPSFAATVSISNKSQISIEVIDVYGNVTNKTYIINREGAEIAASNPMGKTWVVFIENSQYQTFASLDGPTKDISVMKAALSKYSINNTIHKSNMTKAEMEKFFSIELRDMVIKNRVNSIVVWYAGHGKFLNNSGYWIPVDGKTDDEFTYFNITSLKSGMQSYSSVITHTLVITDACESGPSFYQAMRSDITERDCSDWKATKFKSSQVFSSAGYELASDNSQFTKTFANSLIHNPNSCIPIESIVKKVKSAVTKNNQQEPQFGKIDGMADENGTFFFIRK